MLVLKNFSRHLSTSPSKGFKILFLGQDVFSCSVFNHLYYATDLWREIWIATNPDAKTGRRGKDLTVSPLKVLANSRNIPAHVVPKKEVGMKKWEVPGPFSSFDDQSHVLITASFGRIIPGRILNKFGHYRRFNVHPSLLPLYRGPAPIQHIIADGQTQAGVSIISLENVSKGIDSGDIWGSRTVDVVPDATFHSLRATLADVGGDLLVSVLRRLAAGTISPIPQNLDQATNAPFIRRQFTHVQWETWDAHRLDRVHRAAHHQHALVAQLPYMLTVQIKNFDIRSPPAPLHPRLKLPGESIYDPQTQSIVVRCAGQTEINATLLQQENKCELGARDFWNGIRPEGLQDGVMKLHSLSQ